MGSDDDMYIGDDAHDSDQEYFVNASDDSDDENYVVLSEADIRERQETDITNLSNLLSLTRSESSTLLTHFNWNVTKVHEEWFADEAGLRKTVGLSTNPNPNPNVVDVEIDVESTCGVCFETFKKVEMYDASCGHPFCTNCWRSYISTSIHDGPGCLTLRCPDPSCGASVGRDTVEALVVSEDDRRKYDKYLGRSYVEDNRKTKWCPAPGCDYAVDFVTSVGSNCDVICGCDYGFCWNCSEEAHSPVECGTVKKWLGKNSSESETTTWILAKTKPCPKCKRPIEKNMGCMHMTCSRPCRFQFCWLCLGSWSDHATITYACNKFERSGKDGEDEKRRNAAKKSLARYSHYYERWAANEKSRQKAVSDLEEMEKVQLNKLSEVQCELKAQLTFVVEAWSQIVECRRVLKWTYAYGYYIAEEESAKRQLFEYLQGEAEAGLERLHHCAEEEIKMFLTNGQSVDEFSRFRTKLKDLTSVTGNYFDNLVRALGNGLSELDPKGGMTPSSRPRVGKKRKKNVIDIETSTSSGTNIIGIDDDDVVLNYWPCDQCTYLNVVSDASCRMCNQQT